MPEIGTTQAQTGTKIDDIRRSLKDFIKQEIRQMSVSFPVVVVAYIEPVPKWRTGEMIPGVLHARAWVKPKYKRMIAGGQEVEMPDLFWVPVSWWRMGDAVFKFRPKKGQVLTVVCSDKALDTLLATKNLEHFGPTIERQFGLEDAIVYPFGVRTEDEPFLPAEFLKDPVYIAIVKEEGGSLIPISKFVMRGLEAPVPGEIRFECPRFVVITPDLHLGDIGGPKVTRIGDLDDDTESNGQDRMVTGSNVVFAATNTRYRPGLSPDNDPFSAGLAVKYARPGESTGAGENGDDDEFSQVLSQVFNKVQDMLGNVNAEGFLADIIGQFFPPEDAAKAKQIANRVAALAQQASDAARRDFFFDQMREFLPQNEFANAVVDFIEAGSPEEAFQKVGNSMLEKAQDRSAVGSNLLSMANVVLRYIFLPQGG